MCRVGHGRDQSTARSECDLERVEHRLGFANTAEDVGNDGDIEPGATEVKAVEIGQMRGDCHGRIGRVDRYREEPAGAGLELARQDRVERTEPQDG
ncbi:MAG: hypothetical protein JWN86_1804 [Planctomycetota bacterium]|nr:hypothetical protein [Planctomycetota bacterium]